MSTNIEKKISDDLFIFLDRILSKSSKFLEYRYAIPIEESQAKGLEIIVANIDKINNILSNPDFNQTLREKKIYFLIQDKIRPLVGMRQRTFEGKRYWQSPYHLEIEYEEEDFSDGLSVISDVRLKEIYYENEDKFELDNKEKAFINLTFTGYNFNNHEDVLVFMEVLGTHSKGYVGNFFRKLEKKLNDQAYELGLK